MKNYLKSFLYTLGIILISFIILTILNYFSVINGKVLDIITYIITLISVMVGSFILGKASNKKGYIEGLKYAGIWSFIFLVISIILKQIDLSSIVFFIILVLLSVLVAIFDIKKKRV